MDLNAEVAVLEKSRRILTRWGIWGTALYLGALFGYGVFAWRDFTALTPNEVGDFLAGLFAPLAFWWLVLGYRMQALELEQNSKALRQQAEEMRNAVEQAAKQTDAAQANERYQQQSVINQTRQKYEEDLASLTAQVARYFCGADLDDEWSKYSSGDRVVFCNILRNRIDSYRNEFVIILSGQSDNMTLETRDRMKGYVGLFDDFIRVLKDICPNDYFVDYYRKSEFGYLRNDLVSLLEGNN